VNNLEPPCVFDEANLNIVEVLIMVREEPQHSIMAGAWGLPLPLDDPAHSKLNMYICVAISIPTSTNVTLVS
jgi:hypothetical protein